MSKVSPEVARNQSAVKDAGMTIVLGYSERGGTILYEAQVRKTTDQCGALPIFMSSLHELKGEILHNRRKIKPTHVEKRLFGERHSEIYGPDGSPLGPHEEGMLYAEIDLAKIEIAKHFLDTVGHHARPDSLNLKVNTAPIKHVRHVQ